MTCAGELGCGYADGALTADETVLAAYWRGRCVQEAKLPLGAMAAIGKLWATSHLYLSVVLFVPQTDGRTET